MITGPISGFTPRIYQRYALFGGDPRGGVNIGVMPAFKRYRKVLMVMATGCHAKGQLIMMADHSVRAVETVKVGDTVMGPDFTTRRVISLARGREEMARIVPKHGKPWVVNLGHMLTLAKGLPSKASKASRDPKEWVDGTVREYIAAQRNEETAGSWSLVRVYGPFNMDFVSFTVEPLPEDDYYGFTLDGDHRYLLADGTVTHNCGKTETFLWAIRGYLEKSKRRALILSHRDELVTQPMERAHRFGLAIAREQGNESGVGRMERVVSSTVQSMVNRLHKYKQDEFGFIVVDECHHAIASDYQQVLDYFPAAFILGVSATPKRLDGVGLGEAFEAVAYEYDIQQASADGWLVEVVPQEVTIPGLDISKLRSRAGDLPPGPLGELLAEYAMPVAKSIVDLAGDRPTIVFCATVAHAHAQAEALRRYTDARVESADGGTDKGVRRDIVADFRASRVQYLCNAMLFTEGFDAPNARCIAVVRPTKSQSLLIQCVGRGTRPEPGCVDQPHLRDDPAGRRAAIAASSKPDVLVLDFCAQVESLGLSSVADALAGNLTPLERMMLAKIEISGGQTIDQLTQEARRLAAEEAVRKAELAKTEAHARVVDPFNPIHVMGLKNMEPDDPSEARASEKMVKSLQRKGIERADKLSASHAKRIHGALMARQAQNLSSYRQQLALQKAGIPTATTVNMYFTTASGLMNDLINNGFQRPRAWDEDPRLGGKSK